MFLLTFLVPFIPICQEELKSVEQFVSEIDIKIPQLLHDFSIPGAALVIIENGEIVLQKGYGYADIEKGIKIDSKTGFNIGSISKTVTAWGIMKLVQEGKIDLDAPAEKYLTRWHIPESEFDPDGVTVRRLLSHTAGLSIPSIGPGLSYDNFPTLDEWLNGKNDVGPVEVILEPGTKWEYSGGGYAVLQLIIEEVSGQKFEDFMQAQILDPLGMTNSSFKIGDRIRAASAIPYDPYGEPTEFELYAIHAAAGFQSTLEDFIRFVFASLPGHKDHLKYNTVLAVETVQQMIEPQPNTKVGGWKYGLGYQTVHVGTSDVFIGHSGSNTGWQASFRLYPASNAGFIIFTNGGSGDNICNPLFCELMKWKSSDESWGDCWRKVSIAGKLKQIIDDEGIEDIPTTYMTLKKEQADELDFSEGQLNNLGYYYMEKGKLEEAVAIFKLNIEAFPYAWNVYDSYGEGLLTQGAREDAIENYKQSVKLNPDNENGIKVLKGLGESTEDLVVKVPDEHLKRLEGEYLATHDEEWRIVVEVNGSVLKCEDKYYNFTLVPIGDGRFVNPRFGALWRFDANDPDAKPIMLFGERKFNKVK
jgi:CubicO group peptidase (beta-lactamase class C family)